MPKIPDDKKQQRREMIIDTAFELFAQKGYSATGMRDIMSACNMSKGGIYVYFDSKKDILLNIIQRYDDVTYFDTEKSISASETLSTYMANGLKALQYEQSRKYVRIALEFWGFLHKDQTLEKINEDRREHYKSTWFHIIQKGIDNGEFHSKYPIDNIIYHIMCSMNGAAVLSSHMDSVITDQQIETIVSSHLDILTCK